MTGLPSSSGSSVSVSSSTPCHEEFVLYPFASRPIGSTAFIMCNCVYARGLFSSPTSCSIVGTSFIQSMLSPISLRTSA